MQVGYRTDKGKNRIINEDAFLVMEREKVFLVADGVGGQNAGEVASGMAVQMMAEQIRRKPEAKTDPMAIKSFFLECLQNINEAINRFSAEDACRKGMATTAVLAYLAGGNAFLANLGDSRAYLLREGKLHQLTEDHTFVNQMLRQGTLTPEQAENHPNRHMITQALGGGEELSPDFFMLPVYEGDVLLLCSDGLYNDVPPEAMLDAAEGAEDPQTLANRLVQLANDAGGGDNITAVCIFVDLEEEVQS